ncbi:hypothetical protein ANOBCDAF_03878 [Pleomorphomonas sp. T1.2MG-36]|uniref:hypothetical protein n=1 Tax=Pleomorphomonas sp. T1.2MG-36 TaxID=3041167 RepID=UPI0024775100|nr:hypothetical protein [Pleomorphomonas sp. T1.2MG-36]CAI9417050.1 hypothetical protein ANOBCDAF_03878 [Pleomorphomonas sp. T1.2MG-36]
MYEKDPSGFNEALSLARSAALEHIRAPHRSAEHTPASDDSEQGSAGQLTNDPKFSEGQEAGSERSLGEKIIDHMAYSLFDGIIDALFSKR